MLEREGYKAQMHFTEPIWFFNTRKNFPPLPLVDLLLFGSTCKVNM